MKWFYPIKDEILAFIMQIFKAIYILNFILMLFTDYINISIAFNRNSSMSYL